MIKGEFRRGFNVFYDPKFLFSCDFISIPYSEAGTGVSTTCFNFSFYVFSVGFSFFFPSDFFGLWMAYGVVRDWFSVMGNTIGVRVFENCVCLSCST